ncbi:MAG: translocation/assembly module TamB [Deltaproteobacteria bacterium]|nr:translocation/assembly module TamB [Deltaproteobacteria bacterium]
MGDTRLILPPAPAQPPESPLMTPMESGTAPGPEPRRPAPSASPSIRPPGGAVRWFARILCVIFAIVGALPFALGIVVRTQGARAWAAREVSTLLHKQLGVQATFDVSIRPWPLTLAAAHVRVESTDGLGPALEVDRLSIRPKIFALIQGQLDAGEIEIDRPRIRAVMRDGKLVNLALRPQESSNAPPSDRAPFSTIAVNDASGEFSLDGALITATGVDLDVTAEDGPAFEISLHAGAFTADRTHRLTFAGPDAPAPTDARDEDVICKADARVRLSKSSMVVRRLRVQGAADVDPEAGTRPGCNLVAVDPRRVEFEMRNARVDLDEDGPTFVNGNVRVRTPLRLANRFVHMLPVEGWVNLEVDATWKRGKKLPDMRGAIEGHGVKMGRYMLASELTGTGRIENDVASTPHMVVGWADGRVQIKDGEIHPLDPGVPLRASSVELEHLTMPGMMRDLGVTAHTHVRMLYKDGTLTNVAGTVDPLHIESDMVVHVSDFEVLDHAFDDPSSRRVLGVKLATVRAKMVTTPRSIEYRGARVEFGRSHLNVFTSLGFDNQFRLTVSKGSRVELADVSPLADIPWSGSADIVTEITGEFNDPTITSELSVNRFEFGGFSFGDIQAAKVKFRPLVLDFTDIRGRKGNSTFRLPSMRLDFNGPAPVILDAEMDSPDFDIRDFMAVLHFENDPRFLPVLGAARVHATMRYELGGPQDRCGDGWLGVRTQAHFHRLELYEEKYDEADVDFDYRSNDRRALDLGIEVDIRSAILRKGNGTIMGSGTVRNGGVLRAHVIASDVPLSKVQGLGSLGKVLDASVSATAEVRGTVDRLEADVDARMTPMRIGSSTLPESRAAIRLVPMDRPVKIVGRTRCGQPISGPFDPVEYAKDLPQGMFHVSGQLFGGQLSFDDLRITRQAKKLVSGKITAKRLDLVPFARLKSSIDAEGVGPRAWISGLLDLTRLELDAPERADVSLTLTQLEAGNAQGTVKLRKDTPAITLANDEFNVPKIMLDFSSPKGLSGTFVANGKVRHVATAPELDLSASLLPLDIGALAALSPQIERASGTAQATLAITGSVRSPKYSGELTVRNGAVVVRGFPMPIDNTNIDVRLDEHQIRLERASARVGGGTLNVVGTLPVKGFDFGTAIANITARNVRVPMVDGVNMVIDADLSAAWSARLGEEQKIPRVVGDVTLVSLEYTRPIAINADIGALTQKGKRTRFETYDPDDDFVNFEIRLRAPNPMRLRNNMADMQLLIDSGALTLTGSNQRVGLRGDLRVKPGGRLRLRTSEFEVRQGSVRFDDPTRIAPTVDLTAVTDYRRYSQAQAAGPGAGAAPGATAGGTAGVGRTGGQWRIQMHAHGDAENLKLDLTSEPALSQEDIVLLLTLGVTRAELDQMQASNLGETAALEALSTLTGADSAVRGAIPVIDDFRLGSAYSSRTGRTEPTVTMGKRVTDRVRASVTSGLSENREVRSNVEWQLTPKTSVLGSYDNVNNVSSSALGNLGADMRFRIEFE